MFYWFLCLAVFILFSYFLYNFSSLLDSLCLFIHYRTLQLNHIRKPKRIILIRHGESEGNVVKSIYESIPDNAIELTEHGIAQSFEAGVRLKSMIGDESVLFYVSPFLRSRQTFDQITRSFDPKQYKLREDPRIREQEWGNFQDPEQMQAVLDERQSVGRFFYRFKDGESGADVFDRVSSFMESLFREMTNQTPAVNIVIVSHGLFMRLFLMRFFRWSVEKFHNLWNFGNCEFAILERNQPMGSYLLKTKLKVNQQFQVKRNNETANPSDMEAKLNNPPSTIPTLTAMARDCSGSGLHRRFAHSLESSTRDLKLNGQTIASPSAAAQSLPAEALNDSEETLDPFTPRLTPAAVISSPALLTDENCDFDESGCNENSVDELLFPKPANFVNNSVSNSTIAASGVSIAQFKVANENLMKSTGTPIMIEALKAKQLHQTEEKTE